MTGGGGQVSALSRGNMAASGLGLEMPLVRAGWAISLLLCTNLRFCFCFPALDGQWLAKSRDY